MRFKACLIMPYFGRIPDYFGVYLKSLEGKNFDVLWISDLNVLRHPDNFKIVKMTFDEVKRRMAEKLGTEVVINGGRRLCDFRPMYGKVFEDLINGYDYWGWGDCDLVYGNKFNEFLERTVGTGKYDAVSMHKDYMSGPTCFYRNTPEMCELFLKTNNWREVCAFEGPGGVYIFDECGGNFHQKLVAGEMTLDDCSKIRDNMSSLVWREPGLRNYLQDDICESSLAVGEVVSMRDGHLFIDEQVIPVFHFVQAKVPRWFKVPSRDYGKVGDYRISATGFYYSDWAWRCRRLIGCKRRIQAGMEALRTHGLGHVLRRLHT